MGTKVLVFSVLLAALALLVPTAGGGTAATMQADPALVWGYDDPLGDGVRAVDVVHTKLDLNVRGHYRIRVYGRDFIKNKTDIVRIFFGVDRTDRGPEYRMSWYLGRNPARPLQHTVIRRVGGWGDHSTSKVLCPGMRHQVNYAKDTITLLIARSCLGNPEKLRWGGFTGQIAGFDKTANTLQGYWDYFPAYGQFLRNGLLEGGSAAAH